jgi:hypothetical protein
MVYFIQVCIVSFVQTTGTSRHARALLWLLKNTNNFISQKIESATFFVICESHDDSDFMIQIGYFKQPETKTANKEEDLESRSIQYHSIHCRTRGTSLFRSLALAKLFIPSLFFSTSHVLALLASITLPQARIMNPYAA